MLQKITGIFFLTWSRLLYCRIWVHPIRLGDQPDPVVLFLCVHVPVFCCILTSHNSNSHQIRFWHGFSTSIHLLSEHAILEKGHTLGNLITVQNHNFITLFTGCGESGSYFIEKICSVFPSNVLLQLSVICWWTLLYLLLAVS